MCVECVVSFSYIHHIVNSLEQLGYPSTLSGLSGMGYERTEELMNDYHVLFECSQLDIA